MGEEDDPSCPSFDLDRSGNDLGIGVCELAPQGVAGMTTQDDAQVYSEHYARPFRDAEEREKVRKSLASIGFGNASVDQPVDQRPI
jgi:hypothetical protein